MGNRGEFETEYNNEAEYLLADMAYNEEDTDTTRELKTRMLEIYYYRLEERYAKRKFILDNGTIVPQWRGTRLTDPQVCSSRRRFRPSGRRSRRRTGRQ